MGLPIYFNEYQLKSEKITDYKDFFNKVNGLSNMPRELFDLLNKEFKFTYILNVTGLNIMCSKDFSSTEDELLRDWQGETVLCNLFSASETERWIKKCWEESSKPGTLIVVLIPILDNSSYFRETVYNRARQIRFLNNESAVVVF